MTDLLFTEQDRIWLREMKIAVDDPRPSHLEPMHEDEILCTQDEAERAQATARALIERAERHGFRANLAEFREFLRLLGGVV
jgi:hypothetical protein